jgi:hypothetical protein
MKQQTYRQIVEEAKPATHRLLEVGETIQEGDEYLVFGTDYDWRVRQLNIGCPWDTYLAATRRPLTPEPGATPPTHEQRIADLESRVSALETATYRLLNPGEIIRDGGEGLVRLAVYGEERDEWEPAKSVGQVRDLNKHVPHRRRIKSYEDA